MRLNIRGFTLIELLVVLLLSSVILLAATQVMVGSNRLASNTDNNNRVQENGRFAAAILTRELRKAGFQYPTDRTAIDGMFEFANRCGGACTVDGVGAGIAGSDSVGIILDPYDDLDCAGTALPAVNSNDIIVNQFYIAAQNGVNSLMCRTFVSGAAINPATMLVSGIDDLQLLYGVRGSSGSVNRYVGAASVGSNAVNWRQVVAVKFALLASSGIAVGRGNLDPRQYIVLNRPIQTFIDRQARKVFTTTVRLNNALSRDF